MCLELQWNGKNKTSTYGTQIGGIEEPKGGKKEYLKYSEWSYCDTGDKRFGYRNDAIIKLEIKRTIRFVC